MPSVVSSLHQLFLSPAAFFKERPPAETLRMASALVVVFAVCLTATVLLLGSMLGGVVDATVTVDNPDRPPEPFCDEDQPISSVSPSDGVPEDCDEPETIERDAGVLVQEEIRVYSWLGVVLPFVMWLLGAAVLYGAGRFAGGTPSGRGTLALAGWAALPDISRVAVVVVGFRYVFSGMTITDPERGVSAVEEAAASLETLLLASALGVFFCQW